MPRQPRIDAPGYLYHLIARGIERRLIFRDNKDRNFFLKRLGKLACEARTPVYAFALMPNHIHLLIRRAELPVASLMHRLLTSYAVYFNNRHNRAGHLFQNRYKSIICDEEVYFRELVRYVNLNPLKGRVVGSLEALARYRYCSHSHLVGARQSEWYDPLHALAAFGSSEENARRAYSVFLREGMDQPAGEACPDLDGGGLARSLHAGKADADGRRVFDERVLGLGEFVERIRMPLIAGAAAERQVFTKIIAESCGSFDVTEADLLGSSRKRNISSARALAAFRLQRELGMAGSDIARRFAVSPQAVAKMIRRHGAG